MLCPLCGHESPHHPQVLVSLTGEVQGTAPVWCDECDDPCWRECICGHGGDDHYVYHRFGPDGAREQMRCVKCDPLAGRMETNFALVEGTYVDAMYRAADHDYVEAVIP